MQDIYEYINRLVFDAPELAKARTTKDGRDLPLRYPYSKLRSILAAFTRGGEDRLVVMSGLRGTGKTVMLLQLYRYLTEHLRIPMKRVLYFSADSAPFSIREIVEAFVELQGAPSPSRLSERIYVLVDEAHYDKDWGKTAKYIYDTAPNVFAVYTGSAALLLETSPDVLRRSIKLRVFPLCFSEYLMLRAFWEGKKWLPEPHLSSYARDFLLNPTEENFDKLLKAAKKSFDRAENVFGTEISKLFVEYLLFGGLPTSDFGSTALIHERIRDVVKRIVEADIPRIQNIESKTINTAEKVLLFLAHSAPGPISITSIARKFNTSPSVVNRIVDLLEKSGIISSVPLFAASTKIVLKPPKYYFASPTIVAALTYARAPLDNRVKGALLETSVANALLKIREVYGVPIYYTKKGPDFIVGTDRIRVEVGWNKTSASQLKGKGLLITMHPIAEYENIVRIPAWWIT